MWFFIAGIVMLLIAFRLSQGHWDIITWMALNRGARKGILIVMALVMVASVIAMSGCTTTMVAGIDHHYDGRSPQCESGGDDTATSNIGFKAKHQLPDGLTISATYQHHSCAFGSDAKEYNAVGVELEQELWEM